MLLHHRKTGLLILTIFTLLVFVGVIREFLPSRWSFHSLRWSNGASDFQSDPGTSDTHDQHDLGGTLPTETSRTDVEDSIAVSPEKPATEAKPHQIDPTRWLNAIRDYDSKEFKRLFCPTPDHGRYDYLKTMHRSADAPQTPPSYKPYFFALNLHESIKVLPRLLGTIVETIRILGPENCALSIVEGRSDDGTFEVLSALNQSLPEGVDYYFLRSDINPETSGRMGALSALRNLAIQPLLDYRDRFSADDTTVVFFNDVAACPDDILELIHQRVMQEADMTCAMDWNYVNYSGSYRLTFYDVWIARTMSGQSFFHIPFGGSWNESMHLFWGDNDDDRLAKARFDRGLPFQVFTCWNGGVVFTAKPVMKDGVQFRVNRDDECYQGEVSLFTKDMWMKDYGRIAVIPSVNLAYDDETAQRIQAEKGLPSEWIQRQAREGSVMVPWKKDPPPKILCIPNWVLQPQYWVDWNE